MKLHSSHIFILSFAIFILVGTILLSLPIASQEGSLSVVDALFMATSAMCVTGLTVIDISTKLTHFGQIVILVLIQFGGLGIMTFSTIFLMMAGKHLSTRNRTAMQGMFSFSGTNLESIIKHIFFFTFLIEGLGTVALAIRWGMDRPIGEAIYFGLFHSISAFCNAGFTLFSDNLSSYRSDTMVNLIFIFLIVSGGLGFLILREIKVMFRPGFSRRRWRELSLHSKMALTITGIMLILGTMLFFTQEYNNTLTGLSIPKKILVSLFQSVTARTAGFNTIDFSHMTNATLLGATLLMFVGACPGSTGGGVKTTTLGVLLAIIRARFRAREDVSIFKRTLPIETVSRALAITFAAVIVIFVALFHLMVTESGSTMHPQSRGLFMETFFEVVSAYGTVGLSMGLTENLSEIGRILISIVMFIGRLGPLTMAIAISHKDSKGSFQYVEESLMIG